jgi:Ca-activated chloride channel family protein
MVIALAICVLLVPFDTRAQTNQAPSDRAQADKTLSPYFFVDSGDPSIDRLPLKDTRVDVAITGVIADVTVRQVYENQGARPLHVRYVFPASTRAAVYGLTMTVGEVRTIARIRERKQAAAEFEAARSAGKSASLLEQSRPNVFSMQLANVLPGDTIAVELKYTELLVPTDGVYEFVYPTVVGPRYSSKPESQASDADAFVKTAYTHQGEPPRSDFHIAGVVSTGVPLQELLSPSHQMAVRFAGQRAEFSLDDAERMSGNRDFILRYRLSGEQIAAGLMLFRGASENFFLLVAEPPRNVEADEIPPREYIFVLDLSGSMNGFPLDTAKTLMAELAARLRPSDSFNIVTFANGSETFAPASVQATRVNVARALQFVGHQNGGGGTELRAALERAVRLPRQDDVARGVVLVTDGYIEAEADVFDYIRGHLDSTNFFALGIGSSVNRYLIEGVARAGSGEPFIVTDPKEAAGAAERLRRYIDTPVLTGIEVTFPGFDVYDVEPGKVADLFASRPVVVFGKWRGTVAGAVEISGTSGHGLFRTSIGVSPPNVDPSHAALRQLWARTRIADLSDFGPASPSEERVGQIVSLGLTYGLLTRYTSFVAVQELVRRTGDGAEQVDQPLPLPAGVSDLAVGVTSGAEPDIVWLAAIVAVLLCCVSMLRARAGCHEPR